MKILVSIICVVFCLVECQGAAVSHKRSAVPCHLVYCPVYVHCDGRLYVPKGKCCPICEPYYDKRSVVKSKRSLKPSCKDIYCIALACESGEQQYIPPGECCPICIPTYIKRSVERPKRTNCEEAKCTDQACDGDLIIPPGACCPICVPN